MTGFEVAGWEMFCHRGMATKLLGTSQQLLSDNALFKLAVF